MADETKREQWYRGNQNYKIRYRDDYMLTHVVNYKGTDIGWTKGYTNALLLAEAHFDRIEKQLAKKKCPKCGTEVQS